jgi:uncharacterized cupin superfamily protein
MESKIIKKYNMEGNMGVKVEKLSEEELDKKGVKSWPVWEKGVSRFDWTYDSTEECFILDGEVVIETSEGSVSFGPGDFVTFPEGLECVWDIKKPVRKHYNFPG